MHEKAPVVRNGGEVHCIVATWALTWKHDVESRRQMLAVCSCPLKLLQSVGGCFSSPSNGVEFILEMKTKSS